MRNFLPITISLLGLLALAAMTWMLFSGETEDPAIPLPSMEAEKDRSLSDIEINSAINPLEDTDTNQSSEPIPSAKSMEKLLPEKSAKPFRCIRF